MKILGIESSCDETAAAVLENGTAIRASVVASQVAIHHEYGGVVPELASREHADNIGVVVDQCLKEASLEWSDLDGIAVTRGPGLVGALLVGLTYAKGIAYSLGIPFVGVNHLEGHLYSIFLDHPNAELPALSLVVSGGHTNLYLVESSLRFTLLVRSRDDAAGEALDKLSKLLGLGYPGGPVIDRLAKQGNPRAVQFSLPRMGDGSLDFSFSGLKTAALRHVEKNGLRPTPVATAPNEPSQAALDLIASFQKAVVDQLLHRVRKFLTLKPVRSVHFSGGVSCNTELRRRAADQIAKEGLPVYFPRPALTTDNAVMIAAAGYQRLARGECDPWTLRADPNLAVGG